MLSDRPSGSEQPIPAQLAIQKLVLTPAEAEHYRWVGRLAAAALTGVLNRVFHSWAPHKGPIPGRREGVLISMENGVAVAYALWNLEERGRMFIGPQAPVYEGMIIGEHSRDNDLDVNALRAKQLTNFRAAGKDEAVRLTPPKIHTLEQAIAYIADDELVEVTPKSIRLRKRWLDPNDRKKYARASVQDA